MTRQQDVLVIGGGVIGLCSAYYLAKQGRQVTVVEKSDICAGCSCGNAGLIVPSLSIPLAAPGVLTQAFKWMFSPDSPFYIKPRFDFDLFLWLWKFRAACTERRMQEAIPLIRDLSRASLVLYEQLNSIESLEFGYQQRGLLTIFTNEHYYHHGVEEARLLQEYGLKLKVLDAAEVHEIEPNVTANVVGGVYFTEDAHLIPAEFVRGLAHVIVNMGVNIRTLTEVMGFETSGNKITKVKTTEGDIEPEQIVLATGSWLPYLASDLSTKFPIQPAKGYSVTVNQPVISPNLPLYLSEAKVAVTPMRETLRFAGTLELAGFDQSINRRRVDAIVKSVRQYVPGTEKLEVIEIWSGLRPTTPDGMPIIGRLKPYENLIIAGGHAMIGVSLGPITGKLVAQLAANETPAIDLTALRIERFR